MWITVCILRQPGNLGWRICIWTCEPSAPSKVFEQVRGYSPCKPEGNKDVCVSFSLEPVIPIWWILLKMSRVDNVVPVAACVWWLPMNCALGCVRKRILCCRLHSPFCSLLQKVLWQKLPPPPALLVRASIHTGISGLGSRPLCSVLAFYEASLGFWLCLPCFSSVHSDTRAPGLLEAWPCSMIWFILWGFLLLGELWMKLAKHALREAGKVRHGL